MTEHHSWQESHHYHEDCSDVKRVTEGERVREKNKEICLRCRVWMFRGKKHHAELVTCQNQETKTVTGKEEHPYFEQHTFLGWQPTLGRGWNWTPLWPVMIVLSGLWWKLSMVAVDEGSGVDQGRRWSIVVRPAMVVQRLGVHASPASPGPAGQHSLGRGIPAATQYIHTFSM